MSTLARSLAPLTLYPDVACDVPVAVTRDPDGRGRGGRGARGARAGRGAAGGRRECDGVGGRSRGGCARDVQPRSGARSADDTAKAQGHSHQDPEKADHAVILIRFCGMLWSPCDDFR
jgi:hypothetical protein